MNIELLGFAAAFCTTIAFLPQAIKVFKTKHTKDISFGMFSLLMIGLSMWLVYGLIINSNPIIFANTLTLLFSGYIFIMKIKLDLIKKD
jgi:MtN3 and saliva related transmembrane protein